MRILVMGHRRGLTKVLEKRGLDYIIWTPKELKSAPKAIRVIEEDFDKTKSELEEVIKGLPPFSHVISGTEEAVIPASKVRLLIGARHNPLSVIINCADKLLMKKYLKKRNIPMTEFVDAAKANTPEEVVKQLGSPVVIKDRRNSGGRGVEIQTDLERVRKRM